MTLKQLRYLREIARHGMHVSHAAGSLFISQPGVSKQIQLLEEELGVTLFQRRRNKILALTEPGREILRYAEQALKETDNIKSVSNEYQGGNSGNLVIATNHTLARYKLPPIIRQFIQRFPRVKLEFWQGNQRTAFQQVEIGEAHIAIGVNPEVQLESVLMLPFGTLSRNIITRPKHALLGRSKPSLEMVAQYPIITHIFDSMGRWKLAHFFESKGLKPSIVFRAADADVCKAYVELGIGIAILGDIAYDKKRDKNLRTIRAEHLFTPEPMYIGINRHEFHRRFLFEFIEMLAPDLTRQRVQKYLQKHVPEKAT